MTDGHMEYGYQKKKATSRKYFIVCNLCLGDSMRLELNWVMFNVYANAAGISCKSITDI